jgi:hypothetical protein
MYMYAYMVVSMFFINILMPIVMIKNISDYRISLNNIYMSAFMSFSMILTMNHNMKYNILSFVGLIISILLIRNQTFISDKQFLLDMIPHHSMALQTSSFILEKTKDPRIKELASNIYNSQTKEITYMKSLLYA